MKYRRFVRRIERQADKIIIFSASFIKFVFNGKKKKIKNCRIGLIFTTFAAVYFSIQ